MKLPSSVRTTGLAASVVALFALCSSAPAQDAKARTSLEAKGDLVGQRLTLVVELLVPGYFSGSPAFDLPEVSGLLLVPPTGRPVIGSEEGDGTTYTVQRHELSIFAQHAGDFVVPPLSVRLAFKRDPLDSQPVVETVHTQPVNFSARLPPGAEGIGSMISTTSLSANETWKPLPGKAKVGDAFTRTVTFSATGVPGMSFPPFPAASSDGIGVYPEPPEVRDQSERGELRGERSQTITYVCEFPGQFTIPGARFTWWNLESKQLETIDFPAQSLDVAPNPAFVSETKEPAQLARWNSRTLFAFVAVGVVLAAIAIAIWRSRRSLQQLFRNAVDFFRPTHLAQLNPGRDKPSVNRAD
jgi:hypothetical protein